MRCGLTWLPAKQNNSARRSQINAAAGELLFAMIVMEAAFGLPGVIAAPVFYAYAKTELVARKLV